MELNQMTLNEIDNVEVNSQIDIEKMWGLIENQLAEIKSPQDLFNKILNLENKMKPRPQRKEFGLIISNRQIINYSIPFFLEKCMIKFKYDFYEEFEKITISYLQDNLNRRGFQFSFN